MDQTGVDNPCEFFDTSYLGSYGLQAGYVNDDPMAPWSRLTIAGWFNSTRFNGNTDQGYNPSFNTMQFVNAALDAQFGGTNQLNGNTQGHAYSAGARSEVTFGDQGCTQLRAGGDFRYLGQVITEQYAIASSGTSSLPPDNANSTPTCPTRRWPIRAPLWNTLYR